jgi:hypothetical protein
VLDLSAKANITHYRELLIVKGNAFHYLGLNGFHLLSCLAEIFLLFQLTARLADCSIHTADIVG